MRLKFEVWADDERNGFDFDRWASHENNGNMKGAWAFAQAPLRWF